MIYKISAKTDFFVSGQMDFVFKIKVNCYARNMHVGSSDQLPC